MRRVFRIAACLFVVLALTGCGPTVPDFRGMTRGAAEKAISAAGLKLGDLSYEADAGAPTGTVIAQAPDVGARVADGSSVKLTLAGLEPVVAPRLDGLDKNGAAAALAAAGLKLGAVVESYNATIPAGQLISQTPVPGDDTPKGSTVDLVVSKGPAPVAVPRVLKKTQSAATKILAAAGFKVLVSSKVSSAPKGSVIAQSPSGGKAQPGTTVRITVSASVVSAQAGQLIGTWKSSGGSTYTFRPGNRVATPTGGVVRYRLSGNTLLILHPVNPVTATIAWDSVDQFKLTIKKSTVTYKRVP